MLIKDRTIEKFLGEVASNAPTPGGGAVAGVAGAAAAALVEMVVHLTKNEELKKLGNKVRKTRNELLKLADEDARAFDKVMSAFKVSKEDPNRKEKIQTAFKGAAETPLKIAKLAGEVNKIAKIVLKVGNKNAASDAKSAIYLSEAARKAAVANVKINLSYIKDATFVKKIEEALK